MNIVSVSVSVSTPGVAVALELNSVVPPTLGVADALTYSFSQDQTLPMLRDSASRPTTCCCYFKPDSVDPHGVEPDSVDPHCVSVALSRIQ